MSRKAKVIDVEPAGTKLARVPGETTKVIDLDAADARRATEKKVKLFEGTRKAGRKEAARVAVEIADKTQAKVVKPAETADKTSAVAASKSTEPSPYQVGHDDGYKSGFKDGHSRAILSFVATVEKKLAEHDGYEDPEKWCREATIPAWWIAVLITHWEGVVKQ